MPLEASRENGWKSGGQFDPLLFIFFFGGGDKFYDFSWLYGGTFPKIG